MATHCHHHPEVRTVSTPRLPTLPTKKLNTTSKGCGQPTTASQMPATI